MPTVKSYVNARSRTVVTASNVFAAPLKGATTYRIESSVDAWILFGDDNDAAVASADNCHQLWAGVPREFYLLDGKFLHILRGAGVDGNATVTEVVAVEV